MDSILSSIKKQLGISAEYKQFDVDITIYINTALSTLTQLGVGPEEGFTISNELQTWDEFIPDNEAQLSMVKTYIYLKVKLVFDPPMSSAILEAYKQSISELEWRLNSEAELKKNDGEEVGQNDRQ